MNYRENGNILIVGVECKELSKVQNFQHLFYCIVFIISTRLGGVVLGGVMRWQAEVARSRGELRWLRWPSPGATLYFTLACLACLPHNVGNGISK